MPKTIHVTAVDFNAISTVNFRTATPSDALEFLNALPARFTMVEILACDVIDEFELRKMVEKDAN